MLTLFCPSCNAPSPSEARFCRVCGAPLKTAAGVSGPISPMAQTIPLSADGRTTDGLPVDDPHRNPTTTRVSTGEIDALLHRQRLAQQRAEENGGDGVSAHYAGEHYAAPPTASLVSPVAAQTQASEKKRWWQVVVLTVFFIALAAGLLVFYFRPGNDTTAGEPATANMDQSKLVALHLSEARALLAAGNVGDAIERLRSVVSLDPSNVEGHRLLGAALVRNGLRRQAIDEYFAAAQKDPQDVETLHALASLQFQEQLYADAVDSYRRLAGAMGEAKLASKDQLDYADALRIAGYTEDSRTEYQKIIAGGPRDIVAVAKEHLTLLPPQTASSAQSNSGSLSAAAAGATTGSAASTASPTPVIKTPAASKTVTAPAQADPDADYSLGVSIAGARDPKNIPRPELLRALEALQRAAQGGQHRDQAKKLAERLGKEFDRRRSLGIQ